MKKSKIIYGILGFVLACCSLQAGSVGKDTAKYYKSLPDKFLDKKISLDVSHVMPGPKLAQVDGISILFAHTIEDGDMTGGSGGMMTVILPSHSVESLLKKYGLAVDRDGRGKIDTRNMSGTFRTITGKNWEHLYLDYTGQAHGIIEQHIAELQQALHDGGSRGHSGGGPGHGPGHGRGDHHRKRR